MDVNNSFSLLPIEVQQKIFGDKNLGAKEWVACVKVCKTFDTLLSAHSDKWKQWATKFYDTPHGPKLKSTAWKERVVEYITSEQTVIKTISDLKKDKFLNTASTDIAPLIQSQLLVRFLKSDNPQIMNLIGEIFLDNVTTSVGVEQDPEKAFKYFAQAAELGNALAQNRIGLCYFNGEGCEVDLAKAFEYFALAAEQGNAAGQFNLGKCYERGVSGQVDHAKAFQYYELSAKQGYVNAQCNLGFYYGKGWGCEKEPTKVVYYYKLAAEQGNARAQYNLGHFFMIGYGGCEADQDKAFNYYGLAAKQNYTRAIKIIAHIKEVGHKVAALEIASQIK